MSFTKICNSEVIAIHNDKLLISCGFWGRQSQTFQLIINLYQAQVSEFFDCRNAVIMR
jgi:thiamine pyrophosphokinase